MSLLAFITDTHTGCDFTGFQQQPRRPDLAQEIHGALALQLHALPMDLLIHGGDHTEHGTGEQIDIALDHLTALATPVAYCLGNHDLAQEDSWAMWEARRSGTHGGSQLTALDDVDIITLDNAWRHDDASRHDDTPLFWWRHQIGCAETLCDEQLAWLDCQLALGVVERPAVVVVHVPLHALPPALTGQQTLIHGADDAYVAALTVVLNRHPRVKLVLSGHNHVHCIAPVAGRLHVSTTSLIEPPFEFRLISIDAKGLRLETRAALPASSKVQFLPEQAWVTGRPEDRTAELAWN